MPLTVAAIQKLKPTKTRREVPDVNGLRLLIHPSGSKVWVMRFRRPGTNKLTKLTLGPLDHSGQVAEGEPVIGQPLSLIGARRLASAIQRNWAMGRDVVADRQAEQRRKALALDDASRNTFMACARDYIEQERRLKDRNRGWRYSARILGLSYADEGNEPSLTKGGLVERWRDRPISSITADDLHSVVEEAQRVAVPGQKPRRPGPSDSRARDMAGTLMTLFRWLTRKRRVPVNVAVALDKPAPFRPRDRVLSDTELRWFWQTCDQMGQPFGPLLQLLLLTGARRDEVAGMQWDELSDDLSMWSLPASRTKNSRPHLVPLPPPCRQLITNMAKIAGAAYVFTTTGVTSVSGFTRVKQRIDRLMLAVARQEAVERGHDPEQVSIAPWRIHDLRRTCATGMAEHCKVAPLVIEAVLNHASGVQSGVAGTYNRSLLLSERALALESWASYLMGLMAGNVVPLRARA